MKKESGSAWYNEPFYTHAEGYKMQLCVNINGWFSYVHIALELYIMKGPHDDTLTWPLMGKLKLRMLNLINNCECHLVIVDFHGINSRIMIDQLLVHSEETRSG